LLAYTMPLWALGFRVRNLGIRLDLNGSCYRFSRGFNPRSPPAIERNTPRRMRWRVNLKKKLSTALSQDPEVGVK
jgi:hypothetical protein